MPRASAELSRTVGSKTNEFDNSNTQKYQNSAFKNIPDSFKVFKSTLV